MAWRAVERATSCVFMSVFSPGTVAPGGSSPLSIFARNSSAIS
jgi:hypothetical protein